MARAVFQSNCCHGIASKAKRRKRAPAGIGSRRVLAALQGFSSAAGGRRRKPVAVVGFDDIPAAAAAGLTTVRQNSFRKGELAVQILLDAHASTTLPVELIVRDT